MTETRETHTAAIPFNRPCLAGDELKYMAEAARSGHLSGDGQFTARCHALLEQGLGVRKALLTTSCTHALEMTALLLDVGPGDEVIIPSYTFVSVVNAFVLRGAQPVFADVRPDTLNLDESRLEPLITPRTRAIVTVHYAGVACEMDAILDIAARHGVAVIEDNAHGLYGRFKDRWLGTMGAVATLSFHETKNFTCGEGGALLINDPSLIERAEIIREKGTNRSRFFRGQVDISHLTSLVLVDEAGEAQEGVPVTRKVPLMMASASMRIDSALSMDAMVRLPLYESPALSRSASVRLLPGVAAAQRSLRALDRLEFRRCPPPHRRFHDARALGAARTRRDGAGRRPRTTGPDDRHRRRDARARNTCAQRLGL